MLKTRLLFIVLLFVSCSSVNQASGDEDSNSAVDLRKQASVEDPEILSLLNQYRDLYDEKMGVKVAEVLRPVEFGKPESPLGNLAADALRSRASREMLQYVNLSLIGQNFFRLNFKEGDLTLGEVLEFMPYENHLVLLKLDGEMVYELSQEIAEKGGVPVSGLRFRLVDGEAKEVLVNSSVVDSQKEYWLATSNYVADGGDQFSALLNPMERIDFELSIRDLYVDYFRNKRTIDPETDGRIRLE